MARLASAMLAATVPLEGYWLPPRVSMDRARFPLRQLHDAFLLVFACVLLMPGGTALASGPAQQTLPDFAASEQTAAVAREFRAFLREIEYAQAMQRFYGIDHKVLTLYEDPPLAKPEALVGLPSGLTPRQVAALNFLHLGAALTEANTRELFGADHSGLLAGLERLKLVVEVVPGRLAMNDLSLIGYELLGGSRLFLLVDLPERYRRDGGSETAAISSLSNMFLHRIEVLATRQNFRIGGIVADFGCGSGIQALALLLLYPEIQLAYGLEIDAHSINLANWNAALNGVADRFRAIDNRDAANLKAALAGKKLDFAVSNPPFNIVPPSLGPHLGGFGDGGPTGLDITAIFVTQVAETLAPGGQFLFFSQLAADRTGRLLVGELFEGTDLIPLFEPADLYALTYPPQRMPDYAKQLLALAARHDASNLPSLEETLKELAAAQVNEIKLGFVVARRPASGPFQSYPTMVPVRFEPFQPRYGAP